MKYRIVSLVPSITETICDLGLQESLVGRTKFCTLPKNLHFTVPAIGGTKDPHIEKIISLKPTHILINTEENTQACREALRTHKKLQHVTFYECFPKNIQESIAMIDDLGHLFHKQELARKWKTKIISLLEKCKLYKQQKTNYAYFVWRTPWIAAGQNTYIANMLTCVGYENVIQTSEQMHERYPVIEATDTRLLQADYLFFSSEPFPFKQRHIDEFLSLNTHLANKKCFLIDGQLLSWYGTRSVLGLNYLLHL